MMKSAFILFPLISAALALDGVVPVGIRKERGNSKGTAPRVNRHTRRIAEEAAATPGEPYAVPDGLSNGFYLYLADIYVGSNNQLVTPQLDTGSSDLWLMADSNPYCAHNSADLNDPSKFNCSGMIFDPSASTTYRNLTEKWAIKYLDTTGAFGWLSTDQVTMSGTTVHNATFAVANIANSSEAVFGVGYETDEATVRFRNGTSHGKYTNFPQSLKDDGYINSVAYSLYLNDADATSGNILFGGVDHAKYKGPLGVMPTINSIPWLTSEITSYNVILNGIGVKAGDNVCDLLETTTTVLLDSGTSYAALPENAVRALGDAMGFPINNQSRYPTGPCSASFGFDSFEINFSGHKLQVPPASLLGPAVDWNTGENLYDKNGEQLCALNIMFEDDPASFIFGDIFMRNFYIVYDTERNQIAIAQANPNATDSNIEVISSTIPGATTVPGYAKTEWNSLFTPVSDYKSCTTSVSSSSSAAANHTSTTPVLSSSSVSANSTGTTKNATTATQSTKATGLTNGTGPATSSGSSKLSSTSPLSTKTRIKTTLPPLKGLNATATDVVSVFTTVCPSPTTFALNGQTYTVSEATTLTITDCSCTLDHSSPAVNQPTGAPSSLSLSGASPHSAATLSEPASGRGSSLASLSAAVTSISVGKASTVTSCTSTSSVETDSSVPASSSTVGSVSAPAAGSASTPSSVSATISASALSSAPAHSSVQAPVAPPAGSESLPTLANGAGSIYAAAGAIALGVAAFAA